MNPSTQRQIWISYGILFAIITLTFALLIWPPIISRFAAFTDISRAREVERRARAVLMESESLNSTAAHGIDVALLFNAATDALAAAELQKTVTAVAGANGGTLQSTAFKRRGESLPLVPVTIAVRLRCSVAALLGIVFELEKGRPQLFVSNMTVQSRHLPGRALKNLQDELDVQFDVTGYLAPINGKDAPDEN